MCKITVDDGNNIPDSMRTFLDKPNETRASCFKKFLEKYNFTLASDCGDAYNTEDITDVFGILCENPKKQHGFAKFFRLRHRKMFIGVISFTTKTEIDFKVCGRNNLENAKQISQNFSNEFGISSVKIKLQSESTRYEKYRDDDCVF